MEFTIYEILKILLKRIWVIIVCIVLFTGGSYAVSKYVVEKEFTATVSMYVIPNKDNPNIFESLSDLNYAQKVVNTYIVILKTKDFLNRVARESSLDYSAEELNNMVAVNQVNDTEIFEIHVTAKDPEDSLSLAGTIARLAPQKIIEIRNADAVKTVDPATLPLTPSKPNILLNTAVGFALGAVLGIMAGFILETIDKRVRDEEDLLTHYNLPVLGMIPMIEEK